MDLPLNLRKGGIDEMEEHQCFRAKHYRETLDVRTGGSCHRTYHGGNAAMIRSKMFGYSKTVQTDGAVILLISMG